MGLLFCGCSLARLPAMARQGAGLRAGASAESSFPQEVRRAAGARASPRRRTGDREDGRPTQGRDDAFHPSARPRMRD
ncbi:Cell divisionFtsK/SpoIIIE [Cereibacter sphaeroides KD131]|nr:Cell divisionFtsK/SpoIIIE [Cereibacter sphaeroides KD131]